jgi:hypothetical protein
MTKTKGPLAFDTLAWLSDAELRCMDVAARGCLIDLMCYAHSGEPYGHVNVSGKPMDDAMLARLMHMTPSAWMETKKALIAAHRICVAEHDGSIYIKRMVRDGALREVATAGGKKGGNPQLFPDGSVPDAAAKDERTKPVTALIYWNKLPMHLQTDGMKQAVNEWHEYRTRRKIILTRDSMARQINTIAPLSPEQAVHWIQTAIDRNWRGLYPPPNGDSRPQNRTTPTTTAKDNPKEYPKNANAPRIL